MPSVWILVGYYQELITADRGGINCAIDIIHAGNECSNTAGDLKIQGWSTTNGISLPEKLERIILLNPDHLRTTESPALTGGENTGSR